MKKLAKLVGIIALVAVIGFAFITCDEDLGDSWEASNGPWPEEWLYSESSYSSYFWSINGDELTGKGSTSGHFLQVSDYEGWIYFDGAVSGTHYKITSMTLDKQGIKVKKLNRPNDYNVIGDEITLCTGWTVQNNRLTLRGTTGVFTVFEGKALFPD